MRPATAPGALRHLMRRPGSAYKLDTATLERTAALVRSLYAGTPCAELVEALRLVQDAVGATLRARQRLDAEVEQLRALAEQLRAWKAIPPPDPLRPSAPVPRPTPPRSPAPPDALRPELGRDVDRLAQAAALRELGAL